MSRLIISNLGSSIFRRPTEAFETNPTCHPRRRNRNQFSKLAVCFFELLVWAYARFWAANAF